LLAAAARRHVPVVPPHPVALGGATIDPLWPYDYDGAFGVDVARNENDNSLVVRVGWRGRHLLFAGDIEAEGEAGLIARAGPDVAADVVKVPHHGSKTSSTAPFVAATHPAIAVVSVGERNRWAFPNPRVVARWRGAGAELMRTDRDGGVTVTIDENGQVAAKGTR
jgi:competence protein ComEC